VYFDSEIIQPVAQESAKSCSRLQRPDYRAPGSVTPPLQAPTRKAIRQHREHDERNHDVEAITLHSESNNRKGNPDHGSGN
jgi:hypothetical protein